MKLEDGPHFSPDGGRFWARGNKLYYENGEVRDNYEGQLILSLPGFHNEDFSQWTDEQRAAAQAEAKQRREEAEAADRQWHEEHDCPTCGGTGHV